LNTDLKPRAEGVQRAEFHSPEADSFAHIEPSAQLTAESEERQIQENELVKQEAEEEPDRTGLELDGQIDDTQFQEYAQQDIKEEVQDDIQGEIKVERAMGDLVESGVEAPEIPLEEQYDVEEQPLEEGEQYIDENGQQLIYEPYGATEFEGDPELYAEPTPLVPGETQYVDEYGQPVDENGEPIEQIQYVDENGVPIEVTDD